MDVAVGQQTEKWMKFRGDWWLGLFACNDWGMRSSMNGCHNCEIGERKGMWTNIRTWNGIEGEGLKSLESGLQ